MPAASRRHFVRLREISVARVMPAAGSPALCAAEGNFCYEGDACGRGAGTSCSLGQLLLRGRCLRQVAGTSCGPGQLLLRGRCLRQVGLALCAAQGN